MRSSMHGLLVVVLAGAALLGATRSMQAQVPLLERGEEMRKLEVLLGKWEGKVTRHRPDGSTWELQGDVTFAWDLDDAWLKGHDSVTQPNGSIIEAVMWMTWHKRDGCYHGGWQDNVFPQIVLFTATWSDDGGSLVLDSGSFEIAGRPHRVVQTYTFVSENEYRTEMRQAWDDNEPKLVAEGRFTRVVDDEGA